MSDQNNLIPITIRTVVDVTDPDYFCNKSWTLSFNMNTKSWISFHTYIPNFYIGENNFFYSGLNGGCDLEAIAGEEVPFVPTTTSTTTKCVDCKPAPSTTTTSTTIDCNISGQAESLECNLAGSAVDITPPVTTSTTSSTTTFNCTTSTTTTVCPSCSTYIINNPTSTTHIASYTDCTTGEEVEVNIDREYYQICSCTEPVIKLCSSAEPFTPGDVTVSLYGPGCTTCFCYELTNTTLCEVYLAYTTCEGLEVNPNIPALTTINICVKNMNLAVGSGVTVSGGNTSCTTNNDCTTTTSSSTTAIP